jgi:hypothetical protein
MIWVWVTAGAAGCGRFLVNKLETDDIVIPVDSRLFNALRERQWWMYEESYDSR